MSAAEPMLDVSRALGSICEIRAETTVVDEVKVEVTAYPESAKIVAEVLRFAGKHDLVVIATGGKTKLSIGGIPERADLMLSTAKLKGTTFYDPGDLTVGFRSGTTIADVQAELRPHQQFLPLDVMSQSEATVGGVLAAAAHGPLRSGYGAARDYCIGIEFVTPGGMIVKGGGRVVKNVAGYDLMKLIIGSYGTLGVITSANFRVFPRPIQTRTFVAEFGTAKEAIVFRDAVMSSAAGPGAICVELVSPRAHEYLTEQSPRDPDEYHPTEGVSTAYGWKVLVRAAGSDAVLGRYRRELGSAREIYSADEERLWAVLSDFESRVLARHQNAMVVHLHLPIRSVAAALEIAETAALEHNLIMAAIGRIATGQLLLALLPLAVDPPSAMQFAAAASALRSRLPRDASAIVARCPTEAKKHFDVWGPSPTDAKLMQAIRKTMDPKRVLNRGRFVCES
jgi:glycolate oxidase FAD binding subunit